MWNGVGRYGFIGVMTTSTTDISLNPHATELIFHKPVLANKMDLLVHSTTRNAPYIHPSHDSILEL